jgi:glycosyltransferase involved in cell wall biosynthesis
MKTLSIVMPLYNAGADLPRVLQPLLAAISEGTALELLVVDDGSTDGGPELCRQLGAHVMSSGGKCLGPAEARNIGVAQAQGDLLLFVDSDVILHNEVPARVCELLSNDEGWVAMFGSYDDRPPYRSLVSQYVNLRHHWVHQHGEREATTFWSGCGAVARQAYLDVGGFNPARFPRPMVEDIDLGYRLREQGGRILLDKDMLCTHLKRWSLYNMVVTDIFGRALPWTRMIIEQGGEETSLNVSPAEKLKAGLAGILTLSVIAGYWDTRIWGLSAALLALAFYVNRGFFCLIGRRNSIAHMLAGLLLHQLYYHYSVLCFVYCQIEAPLRATKARPGT